MASPLQSGKRSVNLAAPGAKVSRIRRDPPPMPKKAPVIDLDERNRRNAAIGIVAIAIAIAIIIVAASNAAGWSPAQYSVNL